MKKESTQLTLYRAFSTGRESIHLIKELGSLIDSIALDSGHQKRVINYLREANEKKREKYSRGKKGKKKGNGGREGYEIVFIIRLILLECLMRKDYREMQALLTDSKALRAFLEIEEVVAEKLPCFQQIGEWVKAIPEEYYEELNNQLVTKEGGEKLGLGLSKWRSDATVVESNIHYPTDSALLRDGLNWMTRWLGRMREEIGIKNRMEVGALLSEIGQKIYLEIVKFKGPGKKKKKARKKGYRKLIKMTEQIKEHFGRHIEKGKSLGLFRGLGLSDLEMVAGYAKYSTMLEEWDRLRPLIEKAIEQARKRVLRGEKIPNEDKLLSLWEDHSSVIVRGKSGKPCEFGHKVTFWESAEGLLVCGDIYKKGNPIESQVLAQELKKLSQKGYVFNALSLDRGYWDEDNLKKIKKENEKLEIYCPKKGKKDKERAEYEKSSEFREMNRFRVGIEGSLSVLVRRHALRRARLKKWEGFKRHVHMCLIGMNLLRLLDYKKKKEFQEEEQCLEIKKRAA